MRAPKTARFCGKNDFLPTVNIPRTSGKIRVNFFQKKFGFVLAHILFCTVKFFSLTYPSIHLINKEGFYV